MMTDHRTREGQREAVLNQVREYGGFSVFWASENLVRAKAIDDLCLSGKLIWHRQDRFPWMKYEINE